MPKTDWGWEITAAELSSWICYEDENLLVVNKPGLVVCHPSKHGPWSSLIGACREYTGLARLHMPSRLDRETSGLVLLAKNRDVGSLLQRAIEARRVKKTYRAILEGDLQETIAVDEPVGRDEGSVVAVKQAVRPGGQHAYTLFVPVCHAAGYTLARVEPVTGRLHQIRVHAAWLGHAVAGDKLYGPDETLFLEFLRQGWTERLSQLLPCAHQALHASTWECLDPRMPLRFTADPPEWWSGLMPCAALR